MFRCFPQLPISREMSLTLQVLNQILNTTYILLQILVGVAAIGYVDEETVIPREFFMQFIQTQVVDVVADEQSRITADPNVELRIHLQLQIGNIDHCFDGRWSVLYYYLPLRPSPLVISQVPEVDKVKGLLLQLIQITTHSQMQMQDPLSLQARQYFLHFLNVLVHSLHGAV